MLHTERKELLTMIADVKGKQEPIECNRCGECCTQFTFRWSPKQIKANQKAAQRGDTKYEYNDIYGDRQVEDVNAMMAVWGPHLHPVSEPSAVSAERKTDKTFGMFWYKCGHLGVGEDGQYACGIHEDRPYTCRQFKPDFQGGYISSPEHIIYPNCSYTEEWARRLKEAEATKSTEETGKDIDVGAKKKEACA